MQLSAQIEGPQGQDPRDSGRAPRPVCGPLRAIPQADLAPHCRSPRKTQMERFPYAALAAALPHIAERDRTPAIVRLRQREAHEMLFGVLAGRTVAVRKGRLVSEGGA